MTYTFKCVNETEFEMEYSFKEFDQIKVGTLKVPCQICKGCEPQMVMGGQNCFVWFSDPKTLGGLADRNTKYRLPEYEAEQEKKREKKIKEGKYVGPKEVVIPWEKEERKVDMAERRQKRDEILAKSGNKKSKDERRQKMAKQIFGKKK